jgi:agmatinase
MKSHFATLFALAFAVVSFAHDGHHEEQIPMNYVKYPYQATYPGDNEGMQ